MRLPPALRGIPVRALVAALERDGFVLDRQSGSHRIYFNPADQRRAVVPWRSPGSTLPYGTLKAILDDLGWSAEGSEAPAVDLECPASPSCGQPITAESAEVAEKARVTHQDSRVP